MTEITPLTLVRREEKAPHIYPLHDWILVKILPEADEIKHGEMFIPSSSKSRVRRVEVVRCGPGRILDNGGRANIQLKTGVIVYIAPYAITLDTDETNFKLVKYEDIIGAGE